MLEARLLGMLTKRAGTMEERGLEKELEKDEFQRREGHQGLQDRREEGRRKRASTGG